MSIIAALTSARSKTESIRRTRPLLAVLSWELRRYRASRAFGIQALCFLGLTIFLVWFARTPSQFSFGVNNLTVSGFVAGTSAWGLLLTIAAYMLLLGVLLPFVNTDGVSRDLSRRTHELLMTCPLSNWSYVWGRFLIGLFISLGLTLLLLAAIVGTGELLHVSVANYPAPQVENVLILWGTLFVPATIVLSSVGFALGTMLPRQSTLVKVSLLTAWFIGVVILPSSQNSHGSANIPAWYRNWDPTSAGTARALTQAYENAFSGAGHPTGTEAQFLHVLLDIENTAPSVSGWLVPHLLLAGLSLLLVFLAAITFKRFRTEFSAS
jgi:ABC-type transport system involved in multi-copper enzyme maturation permease subunit